MGLLKVECNDKLELVNHACFRRSRCCFIQAMVTLKDIAREAKVSLTTAASILRGETARFPKPTILHIQATASRLGYIPNLSSRNLKKGRHGAVIFLMDRVVPQGTINRPVLAGYLDAAEKNDTRIIVEQIDEAGAFQREDASFKKSLYYDGMIISFNNLSPAAAREFERSVNRFEVPVLWHNLKFQHNAVYVDEYQAARRLGQGLGEKGLRKWLYVGLGPDTDHYSAADRYEGLRDEAKRLPGISLESLLLGKKPLLDGDMAAWEKDFKKFSLRCGDFDAVIFSNPTFAPGWLYQARGGKPPAIFTFDGTPLGKGRLHIPGTVNPWYDMSVDSFAWLMERIQQSKAGSREKSRAFHAALGL